MVYGADNKLLYMLTPEGMVSRSEGSAGSTYTYNYFVKDHIGSTRVVLAAVGDTLQGIQTTDYYPFGLAFSTNNLNKNKFLFSGKEFQDGTLGGSMLGLYDFGARFYDPMLGRWLSQDPMRQFLSPYLYCANNPINFIDPSGTYAVKDSVSDGEGGWIYFMTWTELQGITVRPNSYPGWNPDYSSFLNSFNHGYWGQGVDLNGIADDFSLAGNGTNNQHQKSNIIPTIMGTALSGAEAMHYSDVFKTWSANKKFYHFNFKGNQYTRSITEAKSAAKSFRYAGWALGFYNFYAINEAYTNGNLSEREMYFDQSANFISTILPFPYGPTFSIFYELGKHHATPTPYVPSFDPDDPVNAAILKSTK